MARNGQAGQPHAKYAAAGAATPCTVYQAR